MTFDALLDRYDSGKLTRRRLLQGLVALGFVPQPKIAPTFKALSINHVAIFVNDAERSREFYERTFGLTETGRPRSVITMSVGSGFIGIAKQPAPGRIDHFCFGVEKYVPEQDLARAKAAGLDATLDNNQQLYIRDPDGIRVQIGPEDYTGR